MIKIRKLNQDNINFKLAIHWHIQYIIITKILHMIR